MHQSLTHNTHRTYQTAMRSFVTFCAQVGLHPFPLSEVNLIFYVTAVARRLTYNTIKTYLVGLQTYSCMMGDTASLSNMHRLYYIMRGIRRVQSQTHRSRRAPITIQHLDSLYEYVDSLFSLFNAHMLRAAFSISFFALLRVSEYTSTWTHTFDATQTLLRSDILISPPMVIVHIKQSKVDVFRVGCRLRVAATGTRHCPVVALQRWLTIHPTRHAPLFIYYNGSCLTRSRLANIMQSCLHDVSLNTHSFRIGGASLAASNDLPDPVIQVLGRWSSNDFLRYLHYDGSASQVFLFTNVTERCYRGLAGCGFRLSQHLAFGPAGFFPSQ